MNSLGRESDQRSNPPNPEIESQLLLADSTNFVLNTIPDGAIMPIGKTMLTEEITFAVNDIDDYVVKLTELIDPLEIEQTAAIVKNIELERPIDPNFLALLINLNSKLWQLGVTSNPERSKVRREAYKVEGLPGSMADVLESGAGKCAELSALCKQALDSLGVDSLYVSGVQMSPSVRASSDRYPDLHAFIYLENEGRSYIYDPYNTMRYSDDNGVEDFIPQVYEISGDFRQLLEQPDSDAVMYAKSVTAYGAQYFGFGDGAHLEEGQILD